MRRAPTYAEIQAWIHKKYGFTPKTSWLAHCKELHGLPVRAACNRTGTLRLQPCPPQKRAAITKAFEHFEMLR